MRLNNKTDNICFKEILEANKNKNVYYIPEFNGLVCVHEETETHYITSNITKFYQDAFTNRLRYLIPKDKTKAWVLVDKNKLKEYTFLTKKNLVKTYSVKCNSKFQYFEWGVPYAKKLKNAF